MTPLPNLGLYNAGMLGDANFVSAFVARHDKLERLVAALRGIADGDIEEHPIIIGARGMGKSTLLRRLAIAIDEDAALAEHFMPLRFREEQYNVTSLDAFWRNCGEALAGWCESHGRQALADRLDRDVETPVWRDPEAAGAAFRAACDEIGRRPVLLVDNLDLILDALPSLQQWALRRALQDRSGPVLVGAATRLPSQGADREAAFYEFFQPQFLEALSFDETRHCMRALAGLRGAAGAPVIAILDREPGRLQALHTLTGGNPRVLVVLYYLMERGGSETPFQDLEALLDRLTPYYKARVEEYATTQQRAVIDAIALNWDPITSHALAAVTGIEVTTISSQLNKLRKDGFVEEVATSGARAGYQICERFLNIWYLMRHGTRKTVQRLKWLTVFLSRFYTRDELEGMADNARKASGMLWHPDYREAVLAAWEEVQAGTADADVGDARAAELRIFYKDMEDAIRFVQKADHAGALRCLDAGLDRANDLGASGLRGLTASALLLKGLTLGALGRSGEAIAVFDLLIVRDCEADAVELRVRVARALFNKGVALNVLGRTEEEIAVYDQLIAREGAAGAVELRVEVAKALFNKGISLRTLGRSEEAIAVYDQLIARDSAAGAVELRLEVAMALFNKGYALGALGRVEEAVTVYDQLIARDGAADAVELRVQVAKALVNKGAVLIVLGRIEEAITAYDQLIARDSEADTVALREQVAMALVAKGIIFRALGRSEEAILVYDQLIAQDGAADAVELRVLVARAFVGKGDIAFDLSGDTAVVELSYRQAIRHHGEDRFAKSNLAWLLILTGRLAEAVPLRAGLGELDPLGLNLLDAGIALAGDNFGAAMEFLARALDIGFEGDGHGFFDDLLRFLRLAEMRGYGDKLLGWFADSGWAERLAPVQAAFRAYVLGERFLNDVSPEVRGPARAIYDRLDAPRRRQAERAAVPAKPEPKRRGRPKKRG